MNISYDKLMYDPEHGNLRTLSRGGKLIIPMPQEINNLPNVKLGNVVSESETVVKQKVYVQHNEEDYDGVKVVLSTNLDEIVDSTEKNSTGEYELEFPVLAENTTIKYYIYSYKGELKGNYTEKHVYKKTDKPEPFINTLTFRFSSDEADPSTVELNGSWTKLNSEYNDWKFTANELMPVSHDDEYAFLAELSDENTIVTRKADNVIEIKCNKNSYYYENLDELAKELIIYGFIASTSTGVITTDEEGNNILTLTLGDKYETINLYLLNDVDENIEILDGKIDNNVKFANMMEEVYLTNLTKIIKLDTSNVTAMAMASMFNGCSSLTTVPLFDTSNVTNMAGMFIGCSSLTTVPLFDTSNVTDMTHMFMDCSSLKTVPLFDTSNVTNMRYMFFRCASLEAVPLFVTSSVTNMHSMFYECTSLEAVPEFDTSSVTNMVCMFCGCSSLLTVSLFNTSSVTNMSLMFEECTSLTTVPLFDTSSVTDMNRMFVGCSSLKTVPLFDTSSVTNMEFMLYYCTNVESGAYALYQQASSTGKVTNYTYCFTNCGKNTETGLTELKQIPTSWGGIKST